MSKSFVHFVYEYGDKPDKKTLLKKSLGVSGVN